MLYEFLRVFKESSGTFTDLSLDNQDESATLNPNLAGTDYLYVGQYFPFNNLFFHMGTTKNAEANSFDIEYWDGSNWRDVVDILDGTKTSGVPLAKSGVVQFQPDRDYGWQRVNDTTDSSAPTALNNITVYDCYWIRINLSNGITNGTDIEEITYTFTSTQELNNVDVEINNFYSAFASGKSDWIPEIITATKMVLVDLKRQGLVFSRGQVLRFDDVYLAGTYRTLELIYMNLGPSYMERRKEIHALYVEALNMKRFTFDKDMDGEVDRDEIKSSIKRLVR